MVTKLRIDLRIRKSILRIISTNAKIKLKFFTLQFFSIYIHYDRILILSFNFPGFFVRKVFKNFIFEFLRLKGVSPNSNLF